jgi:uncharacterized protein (TIGR00251 family)
VSRFWVKVTPGAGEDRIVGPLDGALVARVRATPVDGQANEALLRLIGKTLGVPRSSVVIVTGASARRKLVEVEELADSRLDAVWPGLVDGD